MSRAAACQATKQKNFSHDASTRYRPFIQKSGACLLDNGLHFAASTRAHAGLGELRPPRSPAFKTFRRKIVRRGKTQVLPGERHSVCLRAAGARTFHKT
jgi:hypothetical protein